MPLGAFQDGQRIGLEASDRCVMLAAVLAGFGVVFAVAGVADPQVGLRFAVPSLVLRPGCLVRLAWHGNSVLADAGRNDKARETAAGRSVGRRRAERSPVSGDTRRSPRARRHTRLQRVEPPASGRTDVSIKLLLVEISRQDLLPIIQERISAAQRR